MEDEDLFGSNMKNDVIRYIGGKKTRGLTAPVGPSPEKRRKDVQDMIGIPYASLSDKYISKDPVGKKETQEVRDWYEDPETQRRLMEQTGLSKEEIQKRLLSAYGTKTKVTSKMDPRAQGEYLPVAWGREAKNILIRPDAPEGTVFHEKIHATEMDDILGEKLLEVTGDPKGFSDIKKYLKTPGEAYSKFSQFRRDLGLKPGQKIRSAKELESLAKKKGLEYDMFYQAFDNDKIKDAINTIAATTDKKTTYNRLA